MCSSTNKFNQKSEGAYLRTHKHTARTGFSHLCHFIQVIFRVVFLFVVLYGFGLRCLLIGKKVTGLYRRKY